MQNGHKKDMVFLDHNSLTNNPWVVYLWHFRETFVSVTISHPNFMALPVDMMALFANMTDTIRSDFTQFGKFKYLLLKLVPEIKEAKVDDVILHSGFKNQLSSY